MADINSKLPVKTLDTTGADFTTKIGDGVETANVTASNELNVLDSNSASIKTAVELIDDTVYTDGTGTVTKGIAILGQDGTNPQAIKTDSNGELQVDVLTMPTVTVNIEGDYVDDSAFTVASDRGLAVGGVFTTDSVDSGDFGAFKINAKRELFVVQDTAANLNMTEASASAIKTSVELIDDAIVADDAAFTPATTKVMMAGFEFDDSTPDSVNEGDAGAARMSANRNVYVNIRDNAGNERGLNIDASGRAGIDIQAATISGAVPVSRTTSANAETNPLYVQVVSGTTSGTEILSYDTTAAVGASSSDTHSYVVTSTKTFLWKKFTASASGAMKVVAQSTSTVGPTTTTYGVYFTTASNPVLDIEWINPIEIADPAAADTNTVELVRTNREASAQDVYSTIIGSEI